jgi:hypothetical protein
METKMKNTEINLDNLEEIKELLEYALDSHSWPSVEDALVLVKEELGYDPDVDDDDDGDVMEE